MPRFQFKGEMLRNAMRVRWLQHVRDRGVWRGKRKPVGRPEPWRR